MVERVRTADLQVALFRFGLNGRPASQLTDWSLGADKPDDSPARHRPTRGLVVFNINDFLTGPGPFSDIAVVPASCAPLSRCTAATRLLTNNAPSTHAFGPAWSQDGRGVVFQDSRTDNSPTVASPALPKLRACCGHKAPPTRRKETAAGSIS